MRQNRSPLKWLELKHPEIYAEYVALVKAERLLKARLYQKELRKKNGTQKVERP